MRFDSAPDRHRWLSNNSMMVAAKLATSPKSNWTSVKIGDVVEKISTGTTPPSQERRYYDGEIDWYTPSDIGGVRWLASPKKTITSEAVNEKKARMFDAGTILITCIGHIGRVGILPKESSSNQQITGVKFVSEIDPEFAYFSLFAKQDELEAAAPTASTLSILNQNRLSVIDFSYPTIREQKQISKFLAWCEDRLLNGKPFTNDFPQLPDYLNDLPHIVAHIESLAARVNDAQCLREEVETEINRMLIAAFLKISSNAPRLPMSEVAPLVRRPVNVDFDKDYWELGVRSFGNGTFHKPALNGAEVGTKKIFYIEPGDLIFSNVFAWEGGIAVAKPKDKGRVGSHRFITCVPKAKVATARYLCFYFLTQEGLEKIGLASPGGAGRNRTLGLQALANIEVPVPDYEKQLWFDDLLDKVNALRELQVKSREELSALMASVLDRAFKGEL